MFNWRSHSRNMYQLHGNLTRKYDVKGGNNQHPIEGASQESRNRAQSAKIMTQPDQWQVARISRLERISRAEINTQRELEEIMTALDTCTGACDEEEKREIAKRRKRKFMDIAVPHGIISCLCVIMSIVFLVNTGKQIEHCGQMNDYFERQVELDNVIRIILNEYGAVTMVLAEGRASRDLYHIFDETDKEIEEFLPDKTLVKWTILNMLRDYRSTDPGSGSFEEKLVKHAKFYMKVVVHMWYTVQDEELSFTQRHGWKRAYDFQLKTRQHLNVRMLILTLKALEECLSDLEADEINGTNCAILSTDIPESFVKLEGFITDLNSILSDLHNERSYLTLSFGILRSIHRRVTEISKFNDNTFKRMYDETEKEAGFDTPGGPTTSQSFINSTQSNLNTSNNATPDTSAVSNASTQSDFTLNRTNNRTEISTKTTTSISAGISETSKSSTQSTTSIEGVEQMSGTPNTISDFMSLFQELDNKLHGQIQINARSQTEINGQILKQSIMSFSTVFLSLFLVVSLTILLVSILRGESELVICVGDMLKQLTNDVNIQRDKLHGLSKKVIPLELVAHIDFHVSNSAMFPYHSKESTFLMFSISHFMSYFSLFTTAQTIHILTLVMELVDDRIEQYDAITVTCMGHRQIVFSDTTYSQRAHHASEIANLALDIMSCCSDLEIGRQPPHSKLHITVGLHTGPCIGMLYIRNGDINFYVTGSTLNVLQKVHKTAVPNRVQITESTYKLLDPLDTYSMYVRGNINVKDLSVYKVYWLNGRRISTGTSDCDSMCSRIGSWFEMERKPLYRLDEIEGVYEPIDKSKSII